MAQEKVPMQNCDAILTKEPTSGEIGRLIRKLLKSMTSPEEEALLFAADRCEHVKNLIEPAINDGKIVVTDRYVYSSYAYQSARGLSLNWIKEINKFAPKPDIAILIDIPAEIAFKRIEKKPDDRFKTLEFQNKVRNIYLQLAKTEGMEIVDGSQSIERVQNQIREIVSKYVTSPRS